MYLKIIASFFLFSIVKREEFRIFNKMSKNMFILNDNFKFINEFVKELQTHNNNLCIMVSSNINDENDKYIYESKIVMFFLSKTTVSSNTCLQQQLVLANALGKQCLYVLLDVEAYEILKQILDQFKLLFEKSFKFNLFDQNYDGVLVKSMIDFIKSYKNDDSSIDSSDDDYESDDLPLRLSDQYRKKCTHGVRCYCSN